MYYSGTQAKAYLRWEMGKGTYLLNRAVDFESLNVIELDVSSFQFNASVVKMPLYGYRSKLFDTVATGEKLIQGQLMINFEEADQIGLLEAGIPFELTLNYHDGNRGYTTYILEDVFFSTLSHGATPTGNNIMEAYDFIAKDFRAETGRTDIAERPSFDGKDDSVDMEEDVPDIAEFPIIMDDFWVPLMPVPTEAFIYNNLKVQYGAAPPDYFTYPEDNPHFPRIDDYALGVTNFRVSLNWSDPATIAANPLLDGVIYVPEDENMAYFYWVRTIKQAVEIAYSNQGGQIDFATETAAVNFMEFASLFGNINFEIVGDIPGLEYKIIFPGGVRFPTFVEFRCEFGSIGILTNRDGEVMYLKSDDLADIIYTETTKSEILNHLFLLNRPFL